MCIFAAEDIKEISANGKVHFYKLVKNGTCMFDDFCASIQENSQEQKNILTIFTYMDYIAINDGILPATKLNSIKKGNKVVGYEFKHKDMRVYFIKAYPNAYIVLGGYKKQQKKDIAKFQAIVDEAGNFIKEHVLSKQKEEL